MANPPGSEERLVQVENRTRTLTPGRAEGRLRRRQPERAERARGLAYVPSFDGAILFLEDVDEQVYRIDRMLTQLRLAGVLDRLRGFVFGTCSRCEPGEGYGWLTLEEVLDEHVKPLGIPAYEGAMIGHQSRQFTLPVGTLRWSWTRPPARSACSSRPCCSDRYSSGSTSSRRTKASGGPSKATSSAKTPRSAGLHHDTGRTLGAVAGSGRSSGRSCRPGLRGAVAGGCRRRGSGGCAIPRCALRPPEGRGAGRRRCRGDGGSRPAIASPDSPRSGGASARPPRVRS